MARRTANPTTKVAALLIASTAAVVALSVAVPVPASAQELIGRKPWSLFDIMAPRREGRRYIGRDQFAPPPKPPANAEVKARKPKSRVVAPKAAPDEPKIVAVEKRPDARVILVIGDFLASGLAEGLDEAFAENATVRILDRSKGSSGFVRQDVFDWPKEIAGLIAAEKPAAIIVMMGSNDRQPLSVDGKREQIRSDAWTNIYEDRVTELGEALEAQKLPFLWVSMPPFKSAKMSSDMLAFNDIYEAAAEGGGGEFVDIWDGFADEAGNFISTGPDVSGQPVRLRGNDGINLSGAGKAKVAFYVEKPLRKMLGLAPEDGVAVPSAALSPGAVKPLGAIDRTEPMSLSDPNLDGATELLGAPAATPTEATPVASQRAAPTGRADNFSAPNAGAALPLEDGTSTAAR